MSASLTRRTLLAGLGASLLGAGRSGASEPLRRPLGAHLVPAIGMGTWLTFDVKAASAAEQVRQSVLQSFFALGGTLIDSSPMYGNAEQIVGRALATVDQAPVFSASKIWKVSAKDGRPSFESSRTLWQIPQFDLMQIHNMLTWEKHLETLLTLQEAGRVRYLGITTSHGRRHRALLNVIAKRPEFDAVQFTYNVADAEAERHLLPAAAANGKAVLVNRPLDGGRLPARLEGKTLPSFAQDLHCTTWAQLCLKFVISHPAVTCAIPATRRVDHMHENMAAMRGPMPDNKLRARIAQAVASA